MGEKHESLIGIMEKFEDRILNVNSSVLKEYPFNVQFFNFGGFCSGSILTQKIVLTAAHCFDHNKNLAEMKVVSNSKYFYDKKSRVHEVWDLIFHEHYNNPERYANDIALIIIHDAFVFGEKVQRAVLVNHTNWMTENETEFVASGWGITEVAQDTWNPKQRSLKKARLRFISTRNCSAMSGLPITRDMFCLYGDQKIDTCHGDSGGGVLWQNELVGVVSHGIGCMEVPSVYTNVFHLRFWIQNASSALYERFCKFHNLH